MRRNTLPVTAVLVVAILLATSGGLNASPKPPVKFGLHVGASLSSQWSPAEEISDFGRVTEFESGLCLGPFVTIPLGNWFALQGELLFVERGAKHIITIADFPYGDISVVYSLDYIDIPVLFTFIPIHGEHLRVYSHIGGHVSVLTAGTYAFSNEFIPDFSETLSDLGGADFGFTTGAGVEVQVEGLMLQLEYRYTMGFKDLTFPTGPEFPEIELRNMGHMILLGIAFPL